MSWTELAGRMAPLFPELSETQVLEKVRRALRRSERYHSEKPKSSKTHFTFSHPDCDAIIGGHIHQAKVVPVAQQLHSGKIKTTYAVTGCAWLRDESYAISAAYEPVSMNQPVIVLGDTLKIVQ